MSAQDMPLQRPALYNPALWSRAEVRSYYLARHALLARILDDFRRERPGSRPQHRLILGRRGMGKSTLLRRLAIGVEDDPELASQWLPLTFPEEQYNVATLADFWLNCLDALGDAFDAQGEADNAQSIDAEVARLDRADGEAALQALLRIARRLNRRLLLLVDNIDLILTRIRDKDWVLREALQQHPELLLVGASSRALETTYDYGAAFYDFFRIDELRGLSETEMRDTIVALASQRGADEVVRRIDSDPARLHVLHNLTGGNPRIAVLLYGVLLKGIDGDVRSDLEALLDEVTPLYKARFDELPMQAQQLLDKVARHWDPVTARQVADALGWTVNLASAQLDRLAQSGVLEKVKAGTGKRMAFQVAERLFNIWYLMRASRRVRRKLIWLVDFLQVCSALDAVGDPAGGGAAASFSVREPGAPDDPEWQAAARKFFARLSEEQALTPSMISDLRELLLAARGAGLAGQMLSELEAAGLADRLRPLREALVVAAAGDIGLLNGVAPEIRRPAQALLAVIEPELADRALSGASL